jgi:hypothetical protein
MLACAAESLFGRVGISWFGVRFPISRLDPSRLCGTCRAKLDQLVGHEPVTDQRISVHESAGFAFVAHAEDEDAAAQAGCLRARADQAAGFVLGVEVQPMLLDCRPGQCLSVLIGGHGEKHRRARRGNGSQ